MRSTIVWKNDVVIDGAPSDLHMRLVDDGKGHEAVAYCGVYVRPELPCNGYWYFPAPADALSLAKRFGIVSLVSCRLVPA